LYVQQIPFSQFGPVLGPSQAHATPPTDSIATAHSPGTHFLMFIIVSKVF
jgi:hypothetical protein